MADVCSNAIYNHTIVSATVSNLENFLGVRDVARGGAEGAAVPPLSLIERFSKDDTTPLTTPKRGKNDVEMP